MSDKDQIIKKLQEAVVNQDPASAEEVAREALDAGIDPIFAIEEGLTKGINTISEMFDEGEVFMPQIVISADAFMKACEILQSGLSKEEAESSRLGKVLIFTVAGDIHDIGKNIVKTMLAANNFEVIDLGRDIPAEEVIAKAKELKVNVIAGSALMTTTMPGQRDIVKALEEDGIRDQFKVIFGGAPVTKSWCEEIGADAYAENAAEAVNVIKSLVAKE